MIPKNKTADLNLEDNLRDLKQDPMAIIQDHEHTIEELNTMIYELIKNHQKEVAYLQNKRDQEIYELNSKMAENERKHKQELERMKDFYESQIERQNPNQSFSQNNSCINENISPLNSISNELNERVKLEVKSPCSQKSLKRQNGREKVTNEVLQNKHTRSVFEKQCM